jgi:hypothetical protein
VIPVVYSLVERGERPAPAADASSPAPQRA